MTKKIIFEICAGIVFSTGIGLILLEFVFQYELLAYSGITGFAVCLLCAYLITAMVMKEKPGISKKDLGKVKFPNINLGG